MITTLGRIACGLALAVSALAAAQDKLTFSTDWLARGRAWRLSTRRWPNGIYKRYGLDVTFKSGGPQVNGLQLLAAGRLDVVMADALQVISAVEQQRPGDGDRRDVPEESDGRSSRIRASRASPTSRASRSRSAPPANTTFWPWLDSSAMASPTTRSVPTRSACSRSSPTPRLSQQGFVTSEPFSIEKGGVKPVVFLLADLGYPPYSEALVVTRDTLAKRARRAARGSSLASAEGWKSYLANPAPGNALIKQAQSRR